MELRHLRYFVAVADAGSFVKAAERLNVAQPALSRQVMDLERELGVTLFNRLPQGTKLTRHGQSFLTDARRLIFGANRAAARARGHARAELCVAYGELLVHWRSVSNVFHAFQVAYPTTPFHALPMTRAEIREGLRDDRVDVGIIGVMHWPPRGVDALRIEDASLTGVLLPSEHPLAARDRVRVRDLASLTWFHLGPEATWGVYERLRDELRARGFSAKHRVARPGSYAFLPLIAAGDGWALADRELGAVVESMTRGITYRPLDEPPIPVWVALLWKKRQRVDRVLDFVAVARQLCAPQGDEGPPAPPRISEP